MGALVCILDDRKRRSVTIIEVAACCPSSVVYRCYELWRLDRWPKDGLLLMLSSNETLGAGQGR
jgi:hypothetical protein